MAYIGRRGVDGEHVELTAEGIDQMRSYAAHPRTSPSSARQAVRVTLCAAKR